MATKNLIPRGSGEGGLGISDTVWGHGYFNTGHFNEDIYISGVPLSVALEEAGVGGKWEDSTNAGDIYYSAGKVGIGTETANEPLRISSAGNAGDNVRLAGFEVPGAAGNLLVARIMGQSTNNSSECQFSFDLVDLNGLAHSPVLTIKNGGNGSVIDIGSSHGMSFKGLGASIGLTDEGGDTTNNADVTISAAHGTNSLVCKAAQKIIFRTYHDEAWHEKLTILNNGNVGIGTTSPECPLMIKADPGTDSMLKLLDDRSYVLDETRSLISFQGNDSSNTRTAFAGIAAFATAGRKGGLRFSTRTTANGSSEVMVLDENGNVGIGTTDPGVKLEVLGTSAGIAADSEIISVQTATANHRLALGVNSNDEYAWIRSCKDGTELPLLLNGLGGHVGIGTTSPGGYLHVAGHHNGVIPFILDRGTFGSMTNGDYDPLLGGFYWQQFRHNDITDWTIGGATDQADGTTLSSLSFLNGTADTKFSISQNGDADLKGKLSIWPVPVNGPAEALVLSNYAYSNTTDESVYIEGQLKNGDQNGSTPVGQIVFGKDDTYATPNQRDGNIQFHTFTSNTMHESMRIGSDGTISFARIPTAHTTNIGFVRGSAYIGTCDNTDAAIVWQGPDANGKGKTDFVIGSLNDDGKAQEIAQFGRNGGVRIGRRSADSADPAQQAWGYLEGGSLTIWDENNRNAGNAHLKIVGGGGLGTGQAATGSLYIDHGGTTTAKFKISQDIIGGEIHMISSSSGVKLTSGATSWVSASSDRRSKENISPLENVLDKVLKLSPSRYDYKEEYGNKDQIGFIAQDVEEVLPDFYLPSATEEEMSTVKFSDNATTALLVKAIQEQNALIEDLKSRIETLENK